MCKQHLSKYFFPVSDCVLEHEHMLLKKKLRVSIHTETIPVEQPVSTSCTIEVRGGEIVADKEVMELYFENPKKSGGGEIQKIEVDQESCVAYITFTEDKGEIYTMNKSFCIECCCELHSTGIISAIKQLKAVNKPHKHWTIDLVNTAKHFFLINYNHNLFLKKQAKSLVQTALVNLILKIV